MYCRSNHAQITSDYVFRVTVTGSRSPSPAAEKDPLVHQNQLILSWRFYRV
jgi:hypothetical protein